MTKREIINRIGLDSYYGDKQEEANSRMMNASKGTLESALEVWKKNPTPATREFIGRVLTGIFKSKLAINQMK